ncbi:MAG: hypothetical protein WA982_01545 [Rubrobacteraceae bacterium]
MTILSLYLLSFPVGIAAIFFAYRASLEGVGRGERTIWLACSCGLLLSVALILLVMLTAL